MTLALALRGSDGLVLAADSRVSGGEPGSADISQKFLQVNRDLGVLTYGLAIPGERGMRELINSVNPPYQRRLAYFSEIAEIAGKVFRQAFEKWIGEMRERDVDVSGLSVGFILAGYDSNETNQFRILHYKSPRFEQDDRSDILAAQWHISKYLTDLFLYAEMSVEELKQLVVLCLTETAAVERSVGGPIQMATVTLSEGYKRLHDEEINRVLAQNQPRHAALKRKLRELFLCAQTPTRA